MSPDADADSACSAYSVDPADLDALVGDLERLERALEQTTDDLARRVVRLHDHWDGASASAQHDAHAQWEQGMGAMRAALAEMRAAARVAHDNYARAVAANLSLWQGLR